MERTLSQNEAKVVLDLEWRNRKTVTLAEIREALGASEGYARLFAHRLVKKGWLARLRPGLFQLVPADRGREGVADTNPLAAGAVLVSPYFYSFGTACTHHGLTEQVFSEVYLACQEQRRRGAHREQLVSEDREHCQPDHAVAAGDEVVGVVGLEAQTSRFRRQNRDRGNADGLCRQLRSRTANHRHPGRV